MTWALVIETTSFMKAELIGLLRIPEREWDPEIKAKTGQGGKLKNNLSNFAIEILEHE